MASSGSGAGKESESRAWERAADCTAKEMEVSLGAHAFVAKPREDRIKQIVLPDVPNDRGKLLFLAGAVERKPATILMDPGSEFSSMAAELVRDLELGIEELPEGTTSVRLLNSSKAKALGTVLVGLMLPTEGGEVFTRFRARVFEHCVHPVVLGIPVLEHMGLLEELGWLRTKEGRSRVQIFRSASEASANRPKVIHRSLWPLA